MSILSDELANDPLARGYSGMTNEEVIVSLNVKNRPGTSMSGREVMAEVDNDEYDALSAAKKGQLLALTSGSDLDPFGFAANVIKDIFTPAPLTIAALAAARVSLISRATELGLGKLMAGPVGRARP